MALKMLSQANRFAEPRFRNFGFCFKLIVMSSKPSTCTTSPNEIPLILGASHHDPFSFLGLHQNPAGAGMVLRLRLEGPRWVQTVKAAGDGPLQRWEHNVDLGALRAGEVPVADPQRHAGTPVTRGTKWLSSCWIRQRAYDSWCAR